MKPILRASDRVAIFHDELAVLPQKWARPKTAAVSSKDDPWWLRTANRREVLSAPLLPAPPLVDDGMPPHDWTQHGLGDGEDWGVEPVRRVASLQDHYLEHEQARREEEPYSEHPEHGLISDQGWANFLNSIPDDEPDPIVHMAAGPAQLPEGLQFKKKLPGSSHSGEIFHHPGTGEEYAVKHAPPGKSHLAHGDVAVSAISQMAGLETPATFLTDQGKGPASAQYIYPGAKDAFSGPPNPEKLSDDDLMTIQKHHALDWLVGNHDGHERQFIRTPEHGLVGIDKGQAFKHFNQDRLDWNFHPNSHYPEHEPVHNTLYRNFAKGGREIFDPRDGELGKFVQGLQNIPDEEYSSMLRPYAESAAKAGGLGKVLPHSWYKGFDDNEKPRFKPNDVEGFLSTAVARKNNLTNDMGRLYDKALTHRYTGTKIAFQRIAMAAPDPTALTNMHRELGTHGAKVYADPQGEWLIKRPPKGHDFMAHLDQATADLQHRVGLPGPETHTLSWKHGEPVSAVKMLDGSEQAWQESPHLADVHPDDLMTLQKHHVFDWMIANHDGHVGNFLRTPEGPVVGIDKGQAAKYLGQDRLDNTFHPNYYAREPIYNNLWREFGAGQPGEMHSPHRGELGDFISTLQDIPDQELRNMFRPYAESAVEAGKLAKPDSNHRRGLNPPTLPPNDVDAFLGAMVKRKHNLHKDIGDYYDQHAQARQQATTKVSFHHLAQPIAPPPESPMLGGPSVPKAPPMGGNIPAAPPAKPPPESPALGGNKMPESPVLNGNKPPETLPPPPKAPPAAPPPQAPPPPPPQAPPPAPPPQAPPPPQPKAPVAPPPQAPAAPAPAAPAPAAPAPKAAPAAPAPAATQTGTPPPAAGAIDYANAVPGQNRLLPGTAKMRYDLLQKYPDQTPDKIGGYREDPAYPDEHPAGKALDFMTSNSQRQEEVRNYALANGADYVISNGKMWYPGGRTEAYNGPNPHTDHVHIHLPGDGTPVTSNNVGGGSSNNAGGGGGGGGGGGNESVSEREKRRLPFGLVGPKSYDPASGGQTIIPSADIAFDQSDRGRSTGGGGGGGGGSSNTTNTTSQGGGGWTGHYDPNGGAEQWRKNVEEGLRRNGLPASMADQVLHQITTESSGNPNAQNNDDSNAAKGTPSIGLLQTIQPTYDAHKLPGAGNDPRNPQDNIDAAIAYAKSRYGPTLMDSNGNGLGSGHGY